MPVSINLLAEHREFANKLGSYLEVKKLPQALLLVGPRQSKLLQFVQYIVAKIACVHHEPCGVCSTCIMLTEETFPDVSYVGQQGQDKAIKIDQIRALQHDIFQTPKRGKNRFVIITAADKMNSAAANALLKMLEEPPLHTVFILMANQIKTIPATILSRCQRFVFPHRHPIHYLSLLGETEEGSMRAELINQLETFIQSLIQVAKGKHSPCQFATTWSEYPLEDLLWLLYLITGQAIQNALIKESNNLSELNALFSPPQLFNQLDQINELIRKLNHNINVNALLSLENVLLGFADRKWVS